MICQIKIKLCKQSTTPPESQGQGNSAFNYGFEGRHLNETPNNDDIDNGDGGEDDQEEIEAKDETHDDVKKPLLTIEPYTSVDTVPETRELKAEKSGVGFPEPTSLPSTSSESPRKSRRTRPRKRNTEKYKFECNSCGLMFKQKKVFKKHAIVCKYGELKCKVCSTMFDSVRLVNEHMDQEHPFLAWKCSSCIERFTSQDELQQHFTVLHNGPEKKSEGEATMDVSVGGGGGGDGDGGSKQDSSWTCSICGKVLCSKANLATHVVTHRVLIKQFACDQCDAKFKQELLLKSHIRRVHCSPEKCRHCGALVKKDSMRKHMIRHHGKKPDHQCSVCFEEFETSEQLVEHKRSHREVHQCELCGKTFDRASALRYHTEWHSDVPKYNCDLCDKKFYVYSALRKHKNSVHAETRDFKCEICGKAFKTFHVFKNHRDIHDNERKHKCKVCGKGFNSSGSLVNHRRVHERELMVVN